MSVRLLTQCHWMRRSRRQLLQHTEDKQVMGMRPCTCQDQLLTQQGEFCCTHCLQAFRSYAAAGPHVCCQAPARRCHYRRLASHRQLHAVASPAHSSGVYMNNFCWLLHCALLVRGLALSQLLCAQFLCCGLCMFLATTEIATPAA